MKACYGLEIATVIMHAMYSIYRERCTKLYDFLWVFFLQRDGENKHLICVDHINYMIQNNNKKGHFFYLVYPNGVCIFITVLFLETKYNGIFLVCAQIIGIVFCLCYSTRLTEMVQVVR
ncbi:hypothetical protein ACJX0J_023812 [Zea mays]